MPPKVPSSDSNNPNAPAPTSATANTNASPTQTSTAHRQDSKEAAKNTNNSNSTSNTTTVTATTRQTEASKRATSAAPPSGGNTLNTGQPQGPGGGLNSNRRLSNISNIPMNLQQGQGQGGENAGPKVSIYAGSGQNAVGRETTVTGNTNAMYHKRQSYNTNRFGSSGNNNTTAGNTNMNALATVNQGSNVTGTQQTTVKVLPMDDPNHPKFFWNHWGAGALVKENQKEVQTIEDQLPSSIDPYAQPDLHSIDPQYCPYHIYYTAEKMNNSGINVPSHARPLGPSAEANLSLLRKDLVSTNLSLDSAARRRRIICRGRKDDTSSMQSVVAVTATALEMVTRQSNINRLKTRHDEILNIPWRMVERRQQIKKQMVELKKNIAFKIKHNGNVSEVLDKTYRPLPISGVIDEWLLIKAHQPERNFSKGFWLNRFSLTNKLEAMTALRIQLRMQGVRYIDQFMKADQVYQYEKMRQKEIDDRREIIEDDDYRLAVEQNFQTNGSHKILHRKVPKVKIELSSEDLRWKKLEQTTREKILFNSDGDKAARVRQMQKKAKNTGNMITNGATGDNHSATNHFVSDYDQVLYKNLNNSLNNNNTSGTTRHFPNTRNQVESIIKCIYDYDENILRDPNNYDQIVDKVNNPLYLPPANEQFVPDFVFPESFSKALTHEDIDNKFKSVITNIKKRTTQFGLIDSNQQQIQAFQAYQNHRKSQIAMRRDGLLEDNNPKGQSSSNKKGGKNLNTQNLDPSDANTTTGGPGGKGKKNTQNQNKDKALQQGDKDNSGEKGNTSGGKGPKSQNNANTTNSNTAASNNVNDQSQSDKLQSDQIQLNNMITAHMHAKQDAPKDPSTMLNKTRPTGGPGGIGGIGIGIHRADSITSGGVAQAAATGGVNNRRNSVIQITDKLKNIDQFEKEQFSTGQSYDGSKLMSNEQQQQYPDPQTTKFLYKNQLIGQGTHYQIIPFQPSSKPPPTSYDRYQTFKRLLKQPFSHQIEKQGTAKMKELKQMVEIENREKREQMVREKKQYDRERVVQKKRMLEQYGEDGPQGDDLIGMSFALGGMGNLGFKASDINNPNPNMANTNAASNTNLNATSNTTNTSETNTNLNSTNQQGSSTTNQKPAPTKGTKPNLVGPDITTNKGKKGDKSNSQKDKDSGSAGATTTGGSTNKDKDKDNQMNPSSITGSTSSNMIAYLNPDGCSYSLPQINIVPFLPDGITLNPDYINTIREIQIEVPQIVVANNAGPNNVNTITTTVTQPTTTTTGGSGPSTTNKDTTAAALQNQPQ